MGPELRIEIATVTPSSRQYKITAVGECQRAYDRSAEVGYVGFVVGHCWYLLSVEAPLQRRLRTPGV